jgi:hypothetical protein
MKRSARTCALAGLTKQRQTACALLLVAALAVACRSDSRTQSNGIPPQAQAAIDAFLKDVDEGRYEKIYNDAADEWKRTATLEETRQALTTLKEKLGGVRLRTVQTIRDQQNSGGELPGHSLVIIYETDFERTKAMEKLTLVERDGRWLAATYRVSSSALKQ